MKEELVTVVVPVYNVVPYITRCLKSIVEQTYQNLEIIIINDGSTDGSLHICENFSRRDARIKIINQKNGGLSAARNLGIEKSHGKYLIFVDSDDWIKKDLVQYCMEKINIYRVPLMMFSLKVINNGQEVLGFEEPNIGHVKGKYAVKRMFKGDFGSYSVKIIAEKHVYTDNAITFPLKRHFEDLATTYKLLLSVDNCYISSKKLYNYEQHDTSITHSYVHKDFYDILSTFGEIKNFVNLGSEVNQDVLKMQFEMIITLIIKMEDWDTSLKGIFQPRTLQQKGQFKEMIAALDEIFKELNKSKFRQMVQLLCLKTKVYPIIKYFKSS